MHSQVVVTLTACLAIATTSQGESPTTPDSPSLQSNEAPKSANTDLQLPHLLNGRTLEEWFDDFKNPGKDAQADARLFEIDQLLKSAATMDPEVSRLAMQRTLKERSWRYKGILAWGGKNALPAIYECLSDEQDLIMDQWCIEELRKQEDASPEAIAALVKCLRSTRNGRPDDALPSLAAKRLSEIGLPALEALLQDRLVEGHTSGWNSRAIEGIGAIAADRVLEFSLEHPEASLFNAIGEFCRRAPEDLAPKLVKVLQNTEHKDCHIAVLRALARAVEPKVESYKRIPVELECEHVVELALPFLDEEAALPYVATIVAGWSPRPPEAREKIVQAFVSKDKLRLRLLPALAGSPELPAEVAQPLLDLQARLPGLFLEPWHRALTRLSPEGKASILDKMREQSATSPRAAFGVAALDPRPATRQEMRARLDELGKTAEHHRVVEALLKWVPNP